VAPTFSNHAAPPDHPPEAVGSGVFPRKMTVCGSSDKPQESDVRSFDSQGRRFADPETFQDRTGVRWTAGRGWAGRREKSVHDTLGHSSPAALAQSP
jgi:hypothetical protein